MSHAEHGPTECSVALGRYSWRAAFLDRAIVVAAALTGPVATARHEPVLVAPFDASTPIEQRRAGWTIARMLIVTVLAGVVTFPMTSLGPIRRLVEAVACNGDEVLRTVGVINGRGVPEICWDGRGA